MSDFWYPTVDAIEDKTKGRTCSSRYPFPPSYQTHIFVGLASRSKGKWEKESRQAKYPLIRGRWGFADGKNLHVMAPTEADLQNAVYNGWLHCVFVTGVLLMTVDGTVAWGKHNVVGSWNDGTAFPVGGGLFGRIISLLKDGGELDRYPIHQRHSLQLMSTQIT